VSVAIVVALTVLQPARDAEKAATEPAYSEAA
jgi:hypothetical protein